MLYGVDLTKNTFSSLGSYFYNDKPDTTLMKSVFIKGDPMYAQTGLCVKFSYLLPNLTDSSLNIYLKTASKQNSSLLWTLAGYQGNTWSHGQVKWTTNEDFKVVCFQTFLSEIAQQSLLKIQK